MHHDNDNAMIAATARIMEISQDGARRYVDAVFGRVTSYTLTVYLTNGDKIVRHPSSAESAAAMREIMQRAIGPLISHITLEPKG